MEYDPIKDFLGRLFNSSPLLHRLFFWLLDLFFLRAWHVKKELRSIFAQMSTKEKIQVLDAGTGFGQYSYFMARSFPSADILAVDIKEDYLQNARRFFKQTGLDKKTRFAYEDLTNLSVNGPFDVILSVDVMEHIEDDRAVFRNFERVLAKGGYVIINTPSDLGGSDVNADSDHSFIGEHVRDGYNLDELAGKLSEAGLVTTVSKYTYGKYGSLAWRFLIKYPMQMLSASKLFLVLLPFYYLPVLPFGMVLNALDLNVENKTGTGVLVVARKHS